MADAGLKIKIGADIGPAVAGIKNVTESLASITPAGAQAAGSLNKVQQAFREVSSATERMRSNLSGPAGSFKAINSAVQTTGDTLKNLAPGANQATNALTNLGRVAQDAPFGFIGIQNNLNPLLESFQRLRAETGSNGAAFKALGSSLMGAGGIGLALSVVSSAFLIFGSNMRGAKKELEGFDKAIADANKSAGDEIARVQVLNAVITDNTRTQSERSKASKELSDILKDLNIKMSQEAILNGQVAEATKKATEAIIERAKARAIETRIGELSGQQLQRDLKRVELTDKLTKAQKTYNDELAKRKPGRNKDELEQAGINQFFASTKVTDLTDDIRKLDEQTAGVNKEIAFLISQIKSSDLTLELKGGTEKEVDLLKKRISALKELQGLTGLDVKQRVELAQLEIQLAKRDGAKLGFTKEEVQQQITGILEREFPVGTFEFDTIVNTRVNKLEPSKVQDAKALTDGFKTDIAKAIGIDGKPIEIPAPPVTITELSKLADQFKDTIKNQLGDISDVFGEAFANIFTGADIGESFANAAKGLMGIIGDILQQIGRNMILASQAIEVLTTAISGLLGPGGAVAGLAAGVFLVATGALIKKIAGPKMPRFADGGIVTGPIIGQIGEMHKPEVIMPLERLKAMMGSGFDNGNGGMQLIPIVNNEGLYLAVKRGERSAGRKL